MYKKRYICNKLFTDCDPFGDFRFLLFKCRFSNTAAHYLSKTECLSFDGNNFLSLNN